MPIFSRMPGSNFYVSAAKPIFDWVFALFLLVLLVPILLIIGVVLAVHFRKSPVFIQQRVGKDERIFNLFKFRTMKIDEDEDTTSAMGKFLRSTSLDELPQLINVLKGAMSFVGPRPLLLEYLPHYSIEEKKRHAVKPGITGWAQVNGRNTIDWGLRMKMDVFYVNQISFYLDMRILFLTCFQLLKRDKTTYLDQKTVKFSEYASKR
ncbi:MAG: sugar transferase [Ekhidna sp.]